MASSVAESAYADALNRIERETAYAVSSIVLSLILLMKKAKTPEGSEIVAHEWIHSDSFFEKSENVASCFAKELIREQKNVIRAAAASSARGRALSFAIRKTDNVVPISASQSVASENARELREFASEAAEIIINAAWEGISSSPVEAEIERRMRHAAEHLVKTSISSLARKQTAVSATELSSASAHALGQKFYIWSTMRDARVRKSHRVMEGVVCQWSEPPNPEAISGMSGFGNYHPGNAPNCRCIALNISSPEDIAFPAKVHVSGRIIKIGSLRAFRDRFL